MKNINLFSLARNWRIPQSMHSSFSAGRGGGGLDLKQNLQKVGLERTSTFRGVAEKEGVTFFSGGEEQGVQFSHKKRN